MVMGQEERKNKAKLEKTQIQLASNSQEYEAAVKQLEETTGRWNKEWKSACDKFQDLEEERLDFTKSSLWTYANIASTVCVSDDAVCLFSPSSICNANLTYSHVRKFVSLWRTVKWRRILFPSLRNEELAKRSQILPDLSTSARMMIHPPR
jgi:predicted nuclease with TOPRIM domain